MKKLIINAPIRTLIYQCNKWRPHAIPIDEIENLMDAFDRLPKRHKLNDKDKWAEFIIKRNKVIFATSYYLALRPQEAVGIHLNDVTKDQFGRYWIQIRGENNKRKKSRLLPVPKELAIIFYGFFNEFKYKDFWKDSKWAFPSFMGKNKHLGRARWNDIFQLAIKEAGLWRSHPTKEGRGLYTAHSIRHARAIHLLEASNFDLWTVANILGHGRVDVTASYLHMCPSIQEHICDVMNVSLKDKKHGPVIVPNC